jgi:hypothetical protein
VQAQLKSSGSGILLACCTTATAIILLLAPLTPTPKAVAEVPPRPCPVITEQRGLGVVCLSPVAADLLDVSDGAVVGDGISLAPARMKTERLLLAGGRIDVRWANLEELMALPGIGPGLASAILSWQAANPLRCQRELEKVPGLGHHRVQRLLPLLSPLPQSCP